MIKIFVWAITKYIWSRFHLLITLFHNNFGNTFYTNFLKNNGMQTSAGEVRHTDIKSLTTLYTRVLCQKSLEIRKRKKVKSFSLNIYLI